MKTRPWLLMSILVGASLAGLRANPALQGPSAQAGDGKREFTISGCLLRSGYAGYQIDDAKIDAIDGKPVPERASPIDAIPKKWSLEGGGNLGPRVGEKVQIVGRSDWQDASSSKVPADEPPGKGPTLNVTSVKTVASSCS
jgi:hypothetical protein